MDYFWVQITGRTDYPMPVIETRYAALAPIIDFIQEFLSGNSGDPKRHSQKPAESIAMIESVSASPRLELFARENRPGWDAWGNECESTAARTFPVPYLRGESVKINSKSWHYRLASVYGRGEFWRSRTDICTYTRCLFFGMLATGVIASVGTLISYFVILIPSMYALLCIQERAVVAMLPEVIAVFSIEGTAAAMAAFVAWAAWRDGENKPVIPLPASVREACRSWHDKYCMTLDIERER